MSTEQNLPTGSKAFSSNVFINPEDSSLWIGKMNQYIALATKSDLINVKVDPINFKIIGNPPPGMYQIPAVNPEGEWEYPGLRASWNSSGNNSGAIVMRRDGRAQFLAGVEQRDAVVVSQLKEVEDKLLVNSNGDGSVVGDSIKSAIILSSACLISNQSNLSFISNSNISKIIGDISRALIMASNNCEIKGKRFNSAIIASEASKLEEWTGGVYKWNSAIIAGKLSIIRPSASYTLVTGKGTIGNSSAQFVCGQNNLDEQSLSVDSPLKKNFIVGNGTGSDETQPTVRSNAFYVTQGGKAWVQKELEVDSPDGVILKSPNGNRFRITVSNTGQLTTTQI